MKIVNNSKWSLPEYKTFGCSGMDLCANINSNIVIQPHTRVLIPTGLHIQLEFGTEAQVRTRSGMALKKGLVVLNSPGTIDFGYTGEIQVILYNTDSKEQYVEPGERIAQLVICPILSAQWEEVKQLEETERGAGGFGSTGTKG